MPARRQALIGIDLGGTKTSFALFDEKFQTLSQLKHATPLDGGKSAFLKLFRSSIHELSTLSRKRGLELAAIGMGCPGFVDEKHGTILSAPNIVYLKNYPIRRKIREATGLPLALLNDVQAGLYGEQFMGAAKGARHVIGVFLGTGVGGALILDGRLYRGATGAAGEIGQFLVNPFGRLSGSDRHGVLDDVVGRHAIAAGAAALSIKQWAPQIFKEAGTSLEKIRSDVLAKAIRAGDRKIEELVRSRARLVGIVLANLVNFLSPERVILGGGLTDDMPRIIVSEVRSALRDFALPFIARHVEVHAAALKGQSVTVGAAKFALEQAVQIKSSS